MGIISHVTVKRFEALDAHDLAGWTALRDGNPKLYSPYFHPGYTQIVASLRPDVFVACAYDAVGVPIAFFPYQGQKLCRPVGAPMTDYHGIICAQDADIDSVSFLQRAGIGAYHYSALVEPQSTLVGHSQHIENGVMMDLSIGADQWRNNKDASYRRQLKSTRRRIRKSEEEVGQRRFDFNNKDPENYRQLMTWKAGKFKDTGKYDVLSDKWTAKMLDSLWSNDSGLRCDMHILYFDDKPAAIDLGLTDGLTFHSWIVGYAPEFLAYAPGIQLLEGLIDAAPELGYDRLDLGVGIDGYKRHYASETVETGAGFIAVNGPAAALSRLYGAAESFGEKSLKDAPGKLRRRYSQIAACEDSLSGRAKAMIAAFKTH